MKRHFATLALLASTMLPAHADAVIDQVLLRRQGDNVNVRVNLRNPDAAVQKGPVVVQLFVRPSETDQWTPIKTWNDISAIKAGNKISRDYFDENNTILKGLAANGRFQAKATVTAPGIKDTVEKISWYDTETGK